MKTTRISQRFKKTVHELKHKKNLADFLDFAVVSFGTNKKDYFLRFTPKPLAENPVFSLEYIAIIDVFLLLGIAIWLSGNPWGLQLVLLVILIAILVFVDEKQADKKIRVIQKTFNNFASTGKWKGESARQRHLYRGMYHQKQDG